LCIAVNGLRLPFQECPDQRIEGWMSELRAAKICPKVTTQRCLMMQTANRA
jgi:hypothetical protein